MNQQSHTVFTAHDLEEARVQGALAGEVRVLKWGAGFAIAAILGAFGLLYQNQILLHERVARVEERASWQWKPALGQWKNALGQWKTA